MAIIDEVKTQTSKLKDMTLRKKVDYIWTYYKWLIIGVIAIVIIVTSIAKSVVQNSKPVYLQATFLNTKLRDMVSESSLENDFLESRGINLNKYNYSFDYLTSLDENYNSETSYAGKIKLIARLESEQVDILCAQENIISGPADVGEYANLTEVLPAGMLDELINKGYEPYYYTEKIYAEGAKPDENGDTPYTEGETYIGGIFIDNCAKLVGESKSAVYEANQGERIVLTIAENAPNLDHAIEFINYVTQ